MSGGMHRSLHWLAQVVVLVGGWCLVYWLNDRAFSLLQMTAHASWIFLPAALRVLYPLVFRQAGIAALLIGGFLVIPQSAGDLPHRITLAFLSAATPLVGIAICQRIFGFRSDLANLVPQHLLVLSVACAAANSILLNTYLNWTGYPLQPVPHLLAMFVGDVVGTLIVLYLVSVALALLSRRQSG